MECTYESTYECVRRRPYRARDERAVTYAQAVGVSGSGAGSHEAPSDSAVNAPAEPGLAPRGRCRGA
eukprot:4270435-Prymnesium_polylepis.1